VTGAETGRIPADGHAGAVRRTAPLEAGSPPGGGASTRAARIAGRLFLAVAGLVLVAVSVPVLVRGALLADDFHNCLAPQDRGLPGFLADSFERLGLIRPARFLEILVTTGTCQHLPFGVAIAVNLVLTFAVAFLLRRLLGMLGAAAPWPDVAAAVWLLQPLGAEVALWPAALHVPFGLAAALGALIAFRSGRLWVGAPLGLVAMLSVEQVILALPLAVWLVSPTGRRRAATIATAALAAVVVVGYVLVPGNDPRLSAGAGSRVQGLFADPGFVLRYPAAAAGAESIPLAVRWAFPLSVVLLALGGVAGWLWAARGWPASPRPGPRWTVRQLLGPALLVVLVNVPVLLAQPRQGSPRVFAPTWLLLAALVPLWLAQGRLRHRTVVGAVAGLFLTGAALSLALSAWVRVETAAVVERVSDRLAARTQDGDSVLLCDVPRAAVTPAPRGAFAVQDYLYEWAAADSLRYYTGRRATVRIDQAGGPGGCTGEEAVVVSFEDLARPG
jgi:hypothetical protein